MRFVLIVLALINILPVKAAEPPATGDPHVSDAIRLFSEGCIQFMGNPAGTRAWASGQGLPLILPGRLTDLLVGPGGKGAAWMVPGEGPHLALSIGGPAQACAVWAERADPVEATKIFRTIVGGAARPGVKVERLPDEAGTTSYGALRTERYWVGREQPGPSSGYVFTLRTVERPGGAFQVNVQVAVAQDGRDDG